MMMGTGNRFLIYGMDKPQLVEEAITGSVIGAFFEVYNELRSGHAEKHYGNALELELRWRGHQVGREVSIGVWYKDIKIGYHRLDMIVDDKLIVENKSGELLPKHAEEQLRNYLTATKLEVGLLLHFGPKAKFQRVMPYGRLPRSP